MGWRGRFRRQHSRYRFRGVTIQRFSRPCRDAVEGSGGGEQQGDDVVIDEASLLRTYGRRFDKVIRAQSYEALVKAMRLKHESEAALW